MVSLAEVVAAFLLSVVAAARLLFWILVVAITAVRRW